MTNTFDDIRICVPADEPALLRVLALNYEENKGLAAINWDKVTRMVRRGTEQQLGIIGVIEGKHGIEATAGFILTNFWFSDDFHLEEVWVFVLPDYRRSTHARRLYEWAKYLSTQMTVPVLCGVLTTQRHQAKIRLAQREMPQVGALFMWPKPAVPDVVNQRFTLEAGTPALKNAAAASQHRENSDV
jgi:hypothetical protein